MPDCPDNGPYPWERTGQETAMPETMTGIPVRASCERCRNPRTVHTGGTGRCLAPGCHGGPDGGPCLGFVYRGVIAATGKPWNSNSTEQETDMPAANRYAVDITVRIREGWHDGPGEALQAAITQMGITDQALIVHTEVRKLLGNSDRAVQPS